jgi:hypothetical protein
MINFLLKNNIFLFLSGIAHRILPVCTLAHFPLGMKKSAIGQLVDQ